MKKWIIVGVAVITAIYLGVLARQTAWEASQIFVLATTVSPDGKYIARMYTLSESDTPSYGTGVTISPAAEKSGPYLKEESAFKGDCDNPLLSWSSPTELKLKCTYVQRMEVHKTRTGDINFILEVTTPKPIQIR